MSTTWLHWKLVIHDQIAWMTLDKQGTSANTLDAPVLKELSSVLDEIVARAPKAVILRSGKTSGFIAGADIQQFKQFKTPEEAMPLIREGQQLLARIAALPMPVIAVIQGFCLGGGLELALACHYRLAIEDDKTKLGLPEVQLGIQPGWGGSVRLPENIGAPAALDLFLSGRTVNAQAAYRLGIVDGAVPLRLANQTALAWAHKPPKKRTLPFWQRWTNQAWARPLLGLWVKRSLKKKIRASHYPAPYAALQNWVEHGTTSAAYEGELQNLARLLITPTCRSLVHVFDLHEQLKKNFRADLKKVQHVHVIGAGIMGGAIAAWCALRGMRVTLQDLKPELLGKAYQRAHDLAKKRLKKPHLIQAMMDRLIPDLTGVGLTRAEVIIEAVSENISVKKNVLQQVLAAAQPHALIATNTSTLMLEQLAVEGLSVERFVGIHFFNPVEKMPLVEIVVTEQTPESLQKAAGSFVRAIDKLPLVVRSAPGFLVNRMLLPYMLEAMHMLEEGVSAALIDAAAERFGMPMGPIALADRVGLDICLAALQSLKEHLQEPISERLAQAVQAGRLGVKSGEGFYQYAPGQSQPKNRSRIERDHIPEDISDRLILRLVNEGVACLRRGVVADEASLDAGSVFGFGFPPFRGGVMHYLHEQGADHLYERLQRLQQRYGERFAPDEGWSAYRTQ